MTDTYKFDPPRNARGHFLPGHGGAKHRGSKKKITEKMLKEFSKLEEEGKLTPFQFWTGILHGEYDSFLELMDYKDSMNYRFRASENIAKHVYDASFNTQEAEKPEMTEEQISALKAAFPIKE